MAQNDPTSAAQQTSEWKKYEKKAKARKYRTEVKLNRRWAESAWDVWEPVKNYTPKKPSALKKVDEPAGFTSLVKAVSDYDKEKNIDLDRVDDQLSGIDPNKLDKLLDAILASIPKAKAAVKKSVLLVLEQKGMLRMLEEVERTAKEEKAELKELVKNAQNAPLSKESLKTVVWKGDLKKMVKPYLSYSKKAPYGIQMESMIVSVRLTDTMCRELEKQGAAERLYRQIERTCDAKARAIAGDFKQLVEDTGSLSTLNSAKLKQKQSDLQKTGARILQRHETSLRKELSNIPDSVLAGLKLQKKFAKHYQRDRVVEVTKSSVGLTVSIVAIAAPGAAPLAAVGAARSGVALAEDVSKFAFSLKKKTTILKFELEALSQSFRGVNLKRAMQTYDDKHKNDRHARRAHELGGNFMNGVLGVDLIPTCDSAQSKLKDIEGDYHRTSRALLKKTTKINKLLDEAEKAEKNWSKILDKNKDFMSNADIAGIKKITKLRKELDKALKAAFKVAEELRMVEDTIPPLKRQLDQLVAMNSNAFQNFSKMSKCAGGVAVSALGLLDGATGAYEGAEQVLVFVNAAIPIASDVDATAEELFG